MEMSCPNSNSCSIIMYILYSFSGLTVATEGLQEAHFAMARKDAVYFYSTDGRGQCYAIEGEKCNIFWFRNYLVIVTKETPMWARNSADIHKGINNRFIALYVFFPKTLNLRSDNFYALPEG